MRPSPLRTGPRRPSANRAADTVDSRATKQLETDLGHVLPHRSPAGASLYGGARRPAALGHALPEGLTCVPLVDLPPSRLVGAWADIGPGPLIRSFAPGSRRPSTGPERHQRAADVPWGGPGPGTTPQDR